MIRPLTLVFLLATPSAAVAETPSLWSRHIAEASLRFGVPQAWVMQVIRVESGGRTTSRGRPIRSPAGAMGLMQVMPSTWRAMRATYRLGPDPDDPRDNIIAGTAYLREMYDRFGYPGLFAAYNAGPARYEDYLRSGRSLPTETVTYVAKVTQSPSLISGPPALVRQAPAGSILRQPGDPPRKMQAERIEERDSVFFDLGTTQKP